MKNFIIGILSGFLAGIIVTAAGVDAVMNGTEKKEGKKPIGFYVS